MPKPAVMRSARTPVNSVCSSVRADVDSRARASDVSSRRWACWTSNSSTHQKTKVTVTAR